MPTDDFSGGAWRLVDSPIRVMRMWAEDPPHLGWAILPVVLDTLAVGCVVLIPLPEAEGLTFVVVGSTVVGVRGMMAFAAHAGAVVVLDSLVVQSRRVRRLVELSALAYWTQVVWAVPALLALWANIDLPYIIVGATSHLCAAWLLAMHATALRVVSEFTARGTWAAGMALAAVFLGVPAALRTIF